MKVELHRGQVIVVKNLSLPEGTSGHSVIFLSLEGDAIYGLGYNPRSEKKIQRYGHGTVARDAVVGVTNTVLPSALIINMVSKSLLYGSEEIILGLWSLDWAALVEVELPSLEEWVGE